ncbi:hypothetical protein PFLUV_G00202730 [Perca fluviatilis]|uniref:Uncharacterized protein n=1 Tax=Perca fluviatilis TaxID=8168 RepID=A0A6A5DTY2_PERFL|nr:hypothetical protein PFLUV_G00202730 [Perca fluviatilis]
MRTTHNIFLRPTYSTGAHHTGRRAHTRPGAVNALLRRSTLYCSSTAGGVSGCRGEDGGGVESRAALGPWRGKLKDETELPWPQAHGNIIMLPLHC